MFPVQSCCVYIHISIFVPHTSFSYGTQAGCEGLISPGATNIATCHPAGFGCSGVSRSHQHCEILCCWRNEQAQISHRLHGWHWHFKPLGSQLSRSRSLHLLCPTCRVITDNTGHSMQLSNLLFSEQGYENDHHIIAILNERAEPPRLKALWISWGAGDKKPDRGY